MRAWLIAVIGLVSACSKPHVTLPMVPPNLTPEQRVQMFNELHATSEYTRITTSCGARGGCSTNVEKTLYLANGTQVYHPEDLLPVVGPDSMTARAVRKVHEHRQKALGYSGIGFAAAVGFIALAWSKFNDDETDFSAPEKLGLTVIGGGLLVGGFGAWYHQNEAREYWGEANESYNMGLAQRLNVCTTGFAVVSCEMVPPAVPPSAMPPTPAPAPTPPGMTKPSGR